MTVLCIRFLLTAEWDWLKWPTTFIHKQQVPVRAIYSRTRSVVQTQKCDSFSGSNRSWLIQLFNDNDGEQRSACLVWHIYSKARNVHFTIIMKTVFEPLLLCDIRAPIRSHDHRNRHDVFIWDSHKSCSVFRALKMGKVIYLMISTL